MRSASNLLPFSSIWLRARSITRFAAGRRYISGIYKDAHVVKPHKDPLVRDYLTKEEVEGMVRAARKAGGSTAECDALLIMLAYRHHQ